MDDLFAGLRELVEQADARAEALHFLYELEMAERLSDDQIASLIEVWST